MTCKEFTEFHIPIRAKCRLTSNSSNSYRNEIIVILAFSKNYLILLIFLLVLPCSLPMVPSSIIDLWNSCDLNIELGAIVKSFLLIFIMQNSGKQVDTILNITKICSVLIIMGKSLAWNQWTVLGTAWCSVLCSILIEIYLSEWQILECFIETSYMDLWRDWPEFEDSNKMMPIFFAELIKLNNKYLKFSI